MINFTLNGQAVQTDADPSTPLLWVVRDHFKLKGSYTPRPGAADRNRNSEKAPPGPRSLHPKPPEWLGRE